MATWLDTWKRRLGHAPRAVAPRRREIVPDDMYRFAGGVRLIAIPCLILTNLCAYLGRDALGLDGDFFQKMQAANTPLLLVVLALAGRPPFAGDSVPALLLLHICTAEPVPLAEHRPELPPGGAPVLAVALAKRPDDRYQDAAGFARDLEAALAGEEVPEVVERAAKLHRGAGSGRTRRRTSVSQRSRSSETSGAFESTLPPEKEPG